MRNNTTSFLVAHLTGSGISTGGYTLPVLRPDGYADPFIAGIHKTQRQDHKAARISWIMQSCRSWLSDHKTISMQTNDR